MERAIDLGSWQTNVKLVVHCASSTSDPINIVVMDKSNYDKFQSGDMTYIVYHSSGTFWQIDFEMSLPPTNSQDPEYYLVLQNPNPLTVLVTHKTSISYERAFMGRPLVEALSRIAMPIVVLAALWFEAWGRHITFADIPNIFRQTAKLIAESPSTEPLTSMQESTSTTESADTSKGEQPVSLQDSLEELPTFLGEHLVEAHKALGIPLIVSSPQTLCFNVDANPGTIDLHIYEEAKFVELNGRDYYGLSRSEKALNALSSTTVHRVRGLEWTPTKAGKYVVVLDNTANAVQKRCKLDYSFSRQ